MPHFQIKHRYTDAVLFEGEFVSLRECVESAVYRGARLDGARLDRANLDGANLDRAYLGRANLDGASLSGANLDHADLGGANLGRANLDDANLGRANLDGANLGRANLDGANLDRASLDAANLARAYLSGATLSGALLCEGCTATGAPARRAARKDGHEFFLWPTDKGWRVGAGCRWFTLDEARGHWEKTRGGTPLGEETLDILAMFQLHVDRVGGE